MAALRRHIGRLNTSPAIPKAAVRLGSLIVDFYPPLSDLRLHFLERFDPGLVQLGFSAPMALTLS
jgi:hypothetical protein